MSRRKGVPCGCDADPCGCSPSKHCVKKINGIPSDPNGDFTVNAGSGIGIIGEENAITIVNTSDPDTFVEGKNIEFTPSGSDIEIGVVDDPVIDGTLTVNGDIIQNGAAYETHAEKVYTTNDYIVMRDGAVGGLAVGDFSGFQVEKYDGTNDGRLVMDRDGVARVGDVGDEQPLLTREESANLNNGALLKWDGVNQKAVDEGTVGSDTKPIKIVNGVATPVTNALAEASSVTPVVTFHSLINSQNVGDVVCTQIGKIVIVNVRGCIPNGSGNVVICNTLPKAHTSIGGHGSAISNATPIGNLWIDANSTALTVTVTANLQFWAQIVYVTD